MFGIKRRHCFIRLPHAGKCAVRDDFYRHAVWNDTTEERAVLIFNFDRPMRLLGYGAGGRRLCRTLSDVTVRRIR